MPNHMFSVMSVKVKLLSQKLVYTFKNFRYILLNYFSQKFYHVIEFLCFIEVFFSAFGRFCVAVGGFMCWNNLIKAVL